VGLRLPARFNPWQGWEEIFTRVLKVLLRLGYRFSGKNGRRGYAHTALNPCRVERSRSGTQGSLASSATLG